MPPEAARRSIVIDGLTRKGAYRCRASISFRTTLMKTSSRSLPSKRCLISSAGPETS